jgi:SPP1 family predicted phage head-tail adaptor
VEKVHDMNRRSLNKQIEIYSVEPTADGYGGNTTSATLVDTRWASVEPLGAGSAITEYGLEDADRSARFVIRKNDLTITADHFVKYRSKTYKIASGPTEIGFDNRFFEFVGQETIVKVNVSLSATAPTITVT